MAPPYIPGVVARFASRFWRRSEQPQAISTAELRRLKSTYLPPGARTVKSKRKKQLDEHLEALSAQFAGQPEICFFHAAQIVRIRRGIDLASSLARFRCLWSNEAEFLSRNLNSKWIRSALETITDHGAPGEREAALAVVSFINMLRYAETDRHLRGIPADEPIPEAALQQPKVELWDGILTYNVQGGDGLHNFIERFRRAIRNHPVIALMFEELLGRAIQHRTFLRRFAEENRKLPIG
jgi:hypothetical protein